jgi:hypothetical protein
MRTCLPGIGAISTYSKWLTASLHADDGMNPECRKRWQKRIPRRGVAAQSVTRDNWDVPSCKQSGAHFGFTA